MRLRHIWKLFSLTVLCCVLMSLTAYADDYGYENLGIVDCPKYCNIRQKPTTSSAVVGLIKTGGAVEVIKYGDKWSAIKSGEIVGYIMNEYLLVGDKAQTRASDVATDRCKFITNGTIYSNMSTTSKVWERPTKGSVYLVTSTYDNWVQIDLDGGVGYVQLSEVELFRGFDLATRTHSSTIEGPRGDLVHEAMKYLGNKYVWGGNDPNTGADCSGYVRYLYKNVLDIQLPRVSYEQCYSGEQISSLEMRPGDLIFYAKSNGVVGHVALYIGNGMIIHAASTKQGIRLDNWNYRTPKYIRNIIGD